MISLPSQPSDREIIRSHLETLLREISFASPLDIHLTEAVSSAVVHYLEHQHLAPPLPDDYLHLLIYRALRSLSQNQTAQAWAHAHLPGQGLPVFDPDVWPGPVPLLVWQLFTSRLVRPVRTLTAEGRILWTLDFRRLRQEQAGWMEITFLPGLRALLEQLAPAWDDTSGAGLLGLRGLYAVGFAPTTPCRRKKGNHSRYAPLDAPAIRSFCLRVLLHLQRIRHWSHTPDVLYLDFS